MFRLELLPAAHGDGIWIEYGSGKSPSRVLLDGGPASTYENGLRRRVAEAAGGKRAKVAFELFVITHIDADHIDVPLILLRDGGLPCTFGDVWFNGFSQIAPEGPEDAYAPLQGEFLTSILGDPVTRLAWNEAVGGTAHALVVPDPGENAGKVAPLPTFTLAGGMRLTLLSPGTRELKRLRARWSAAIRDFTPGDVEEARRRLEKRRDYEPPDVPPVFAGRSFGSDRAPANGSSIAFLAEYEGTAVLLAGDAHARVLAENLRRLAAERDVPAVPLTAFKLPHHGSMGNLTAEVLDAVACTRFLFSTNGAKFGHPDKETVDLILSKVSGPVELSFNYRSGTTAGFDGALGDRVTTTYGDAGRLVVDLDAKT